MTLGDLIQALEREDPTQRVRFGFGRPHSYRGYYDELAFEPVADTTVAAMLAAAREAMGATYSGYKGGEFTMGEYTDIWLAGYGSCGEAIGPALLSFMLGRTPGVDQ